MEKQRRQPSKLAKSDSKADVAAVWDEGEGKTDDFQGGHFDVKLSNKKVALATAAPGVN